MKHFINSIKTLLSVSAQICLAVLIYFAFMWLQMFFNKLPYNLSLLGPFMLLTILVILKQSWLKRSYKPTLIMKYALRTLALSILGIIFFEGFTLLIMFLNSDNNLDHYVSLMSASFANPTKHVPIIMNIYVPAAMEEVLCRFLILSLLIYKGINRYWSILISSIVFSICHGQYNYYVLVYILFIGIAFGMLYLMFQNPGVAIGLHFTINYFAHLSPNYDAHAYYLPNSFSAVWKENTLIAYYCITVLIAWIYTQYIRPRLQQKELNISHNKGSA